MPVHREVWFRYAPVVWCRVRSSRNPQATQRIWERSVWPVQSLSWHIAANRAKRATVPLQGERHARMGDHESTWSTIIRSATLSSSLTLAVSCRCFRIATSTLIGHGTADFSLASRSQSCNEIAIPTSEGVYASLAGLPSEGREEWMNDSHRHLHLVRFCFNSRR